MRRRLIVALVLFALWACTPTATPTPTPTPTVSSLISPVGMPALEP
jgi:hypothetical protein